MIFFLKKLFNFNCSANCFLEIIYQKGIFFLTLLINVQPQSPLLIYVGANQFQTLGIRLDCQFPSFFFFLNFIFNKDVLY
jgi:hypothetical protein